MKNILVFMIAVLCTSCTDYFLDLDPLDEVTEAAYFSDPLHFDYAVNDFHQDMYGWRDFDGYYTGFGSDLSSWPQDYGQGIYTVPDNEDWWEDGYAKLRNINILLQKADEYEGEQSEIAVHVARAKFFRAYQHFFLLQRYGGVPIATIVPDVNSEFLTAPRNSRYEVMAQVITDLEAAIPVLPRAQTLGTSDNGKITMEGAQALLSKALLYEATWEKYVGNTTDGDGTSSGAGTAKPGGYPSIDDMLTKSAALAEDIMDNGGFELWDYNHLAEMENMSNHFFFNLEDAGSNPAGLDKSSNNETILANKYDYDLYQGRALLAHTVGGRLQPSRKLMDMFLCSDGLPVDKSAEFLGYTKVGDEYQNRDYRLISYTGDIPADTSVILQGASGYPWRKFASWEYPGFEYRADRTESWDYPIIRYAEILLTYAEALYELNGSLTDAQLNESINLTKARAGLPPLTNGFAAANGLDIYYEIKRERTLELYAENNRYNDLKRWGEAEEMLNADVCGSVVEGTDYETYPELYLAENYPFGELSVETGVGMRNCIVLSGASDRNFSRDNYLWPIPGEQIVLNSNLKQNPGY